MKKVLITIIAFQTYIITAQSDSTNIKHQNKSFIKHLIGVDAGYSDYFPFVGYKGEANINYIFNPHFFCIKTQIGIAPFTRFGTLTKVFLSIGVTTKLSKPVSFHFLTGFGKVFTSKNYELIITTNGVPYRKITYVLDIFNAYGEAGFYINPFKAKNKIIGVNANFIPISYSDQNREYDSKKAFNVNVSFNLLLNKTLKN